MSREYVLHASSSEGSEEVELAAPSVGIFIARVAPGELVAPGQVVGSIEVLGVESALRCPKRVAGRISAVTGGGLARVPVQYGDSILTVSVGQDFGLSVQTADAGSPAQSALAFLAPMSGRFYSRPSPREARFVTEGDPVTRGQTIGLLEVMKTYNRLVYQGDALPDSAVVQRVVPADGEDVIRGDAILALEPPEES